MKLLKLGKSSVSSPSLILLSDHEPLLSTAEDWRLAFGDTFSLYVLTGAMPRPSEVSSYVAELSAQIESERIKRVTLFGVGRGAAVAIELAAQSQKLVRRVVLLDAQSRIEPTWSERALDRVETKLPLGLPFRVLSQHYDARPILHLVRCPTLVLVSKESDSFTQEQGKLLGSRIPNAWHYALREQHFTDMPSNELLEVLRRFLQVPVKRPQKAA